MNKPIGITIGDINGIGIEILLDIWKGKKIKNNFILITNYRLFKKFLVNRKIKLDIEIINDNLEKKFNKNLVFYIYDIKAKNNADNSYNSLIEGYNLSKIKIIKGLITLPLNKKLINSEINSNFFGQTEFFQKLENKKISNMIFVNKKTIFLPLTNHISINKVSKKINTRNYIFNKIIALNNTLINDFGIKNPKILISGLNPHSGESGIIGNEEVKLINNEITKLQKKKINIDGPYPADSILLNNNMLYTDCFVFFYHDQALIPFKLLDNYNGINYTGGLKIIRVSPDHGTAYDLVGTKKYSDKSLISCFKYINKIYKNRLNIVNS